ncbi:MAG: hypothetical protein ACRDJW_11725 [Thermomicrobiales bacterium]
MAPSVPDLPQWRERAGDHSSDGDATFSPWLLVWTILVAKIGTLGIIVIAARSGEGGALIAATSIPWVFAAAALVLGPLLFRYRLRRVRARRDELRRQEWMELDAVSRETGR